MSDYHVEFDFNDDGETEESTQIMSTDEVEEYINSTLTDAADVVCTNFKIIKIEKENKNA